ncbi:hypothetical protein BKA56DRAFT_625457 [Ilyonectria sp. MPI-CAGE-AT-0026]|nr:hypothetical protein BKA56DRAFT_625457 [Ilyonectria sp. MPI-CAGE-AT-0026]
MYRFGDFAHMMSQYAETQNYRKPCLALTAGRRSPGHSSSWKQDASKTRPRPRTPTTDRPASFPRGILEVDHSSESRRETSRNDRLDACREIISINSSPMEERLEGQSDANGHQVRLVSAQVINGAEHLASLAKEGYLTLQSRGGYQADNAAVTTSEASSLGQVTPDTLRQPASTPDNRSSAETGHLPVVISAWPRPV